MNRPRINEPFKNKQSFGHTEYMVQKPTISLARESDGQSNGSTNSTWPSQAPEKKPKQESTDPGLENVLSLSLLRLVFFVRQYFPPSSQRDPLYFESLTLHCENLAPDEAMTDLWILIDEVGDFQMGTDALINFRNIADRWLRSSNIGKQCRRNTPRFWVAGATSYSGLEANPVIKLTPFDVNELLKECLAGFAGTARLSHNCDV